MERALAFNAEAVPDLLGPGGALAPLLAGYEDRPYQRELALEVARLLESGGKLAVEAPTGIGKSLAYGLPAAVWALSGRGPVVVSTHTKALQEQLLHLESPRLSRAVGQDLVVRILKGRANYLCRNRYQIACSEATGEGTLEVLARIAPWVEQTETGDLGELPDLLPRELRFLAARITSDPQACAQTRCRPEDGCFFKRARAAAGAADLLVINHALLASQFLGGFEFLPAFNALVIDEAHAFVRVGLDHLSLSVGPPRLNRLLELAPGAGGFLPAPVRDGEGASRLAAVQRALRDLEKAGKRFFGKKNGPPPGDDPRQRYRDPEEYAALCPAPLDPLEHGLGMVEADLRALESCVSGTVGEEDERGRAFLGELRRFREEVIGFRDDLIQVTRPDPNDRDQVVWKEWSGSGFTLNAAPLELGPALSRALERGPEALIFASATLAAGKDFTYFAREVGLEGSLPSIAYPSPFEFQEQALLVAARQGPDPREAGWAATTADTLRGLMADPGRKTMALFTSYRDLNRVHRALLPAGDEAADPMDYVVLAQGPGAPAARILEAFRAAPRALLLGTSSFWEGVDLPGDDLEVLVMTRLPFGVPTDPRFQARSERLEIEGGNPFNDLYLPEAVLRFKQGFGRLIRRRSDRGIVAVLDPRFLGKGYGRKFQAALPLPVTAVTDGPALVQAAAGWWRRPDRQQGEDL